MSSSQQSSAGSARLSVAGNNKAFNGVKVFSATMVGEREQLGDKVTEWLRANPNLKTVDAWVTQSSDEAFHCIAITVFYWENL